MTFRSHTVPRRKAAWDRYVYAAVLIVYSTCLQAADLVGVARDAQRRPLAQVSVQLVGQESRTQHINRDTKTTQAGEFLFSRIPPGQYTLKCGNTEAIKITVGAGTVRRDCP